MERLWKLVVFLFVLFLCLDLGSCHGTVNRGEEGRSVDQNIRKLAQIPNKYRGRQFGNEAGWPTFRAYRPPLPAFRTGWHWHNNGQFHGNNFVPPSFSPRSYRMHRPPPSPPFAPQPWTPKFSPPTSVPPPAQHNHIPPTVPPPSPVLVKPLPLHPQVKKPAQSVALPSRPTLVPTRSASTAGTRVVSESKHASSTTWPIDVSVIAGASLLLAISVALFIVYCRSSKVVTVRPWATGLSGQLQKAFVTGVPALKRSELEIACEDFSNIIGSLSDYMVYKGTLSSGVEIAVISTTKKSAKDWTKHCESQFRKKITSLSRVNHKNFVNLLGYCEEEQPFTRMMVFEYAPNGTLFEHLHVKEDDHLDWPTRLRVAMGIAYCLEHMHQLSPPEILRTLDTSTIYLTDDFAAKISDIFFCEEPRETEIASLSPVLSDKESIVYNYGMILLEIISGKFPVSEGGLLETWAACYLRGEKQLKDMTDPNLKPFHAEAVDKLSNVIRSCTDRDPKKRPTMPEVARLLREITAVPPDAATPKVSPLWWAELEIISTEVN